MKTYKVTSSNGKGVIFRSAPSRSGTYLDTIPEGTELESTGETDGYAAVTYKGKTGYASLQYLKATETEAELPDTITLSRAKAESLYQMTGAWYQALGEALGV